MKSQPQWTNPIKAQVTPLIYKFGITLPMFYIEAGSIIQLLKERPEFNQPFMSLPSLMGPMNCQCFTLEWLQTNNLSMDTLPFLQLPLLVGVFSVFNSFLAEQLIIPDEPNEEDPQNNQSVSQSIATTQTLSLPLILTTASLVSPAAVSMNWAIAQALGMVRAVLIRKKLKVFDGIDIDMVR